MGEEFKNLQDSLKPREVLRDAVDPHKVSDEYLLAILLRTGSKGCDVLETARRLRNSFTSLAELVRCDWRAIGEHIRQYNETHEKDKLLGIGQVKLLELAAAFELCRRGYSVTEEKDIRKMLLTTPENANKAFRNAQINGEAQENFFVIPLDTKAHPLCTKPLVITKGTLDRTPVHPREVFREAVRWGAKAILVAHNHPSGDPTPSNADVELTKDLVKAGEVLGIPVRDHIILGRRYDEYISLLRAKLVEF